MSQACDTFDLRYYTTTIEQELNCQFQWLPPLVRKFLNESAIDLLEAPSCKVPSESENPNIERLYFGGFKAKSHKVQSTSLMRLLEVVLP